jgi:hypothetical protein
MLVPSKCMGVWPYGFPEQIVSRPARMRLICHDFCENRGTRSKKVHACHIFLENRYFGGTTLIPVLDEPISSRCCFTGALFLCFLLESVLAWGPCGAQIRGQWRRKALLVITIDVRATFGHFSKHRNSTWIYS